MELFAGFIHEKLTFFETLEIGGGVRYTLVKFDKNEFESENRSPANDVSWNYGAKYLLKKTETTFRINGGKGFKSPTLFQLYSQFGNSELKNQTGYSFDGGILQNLLGKKLSFEVNGFYNFIDNYIDYDFDLRRYKNSIWIETAGIETEIKASFSEHFGGALNYTRLFVMEEYSPIYVKEKLYKKKTTVLRRPRDVINLSFYYKFLEKYSFEAMAQYAGKRSDEIYREPNVYDAKLSSYIKIDLMASAELYKWLKFYGRAENILNQHYQEVAGYSEKGVSLYSGLKLTY